MASFTKKYAFWFLGLGIVIIFFFSRLYNILSLPIFTDEAIYLRWAQYFLTDITFWDYALTDGKGPLFIWLMTLSMSIVNDPLLAGRFISVIAGFFTIIGLFFLTKELFNNKWTGYITVGLYILYPFAVVYDRMALYDGLVGTFAVWGLYLVIVLIKRTTMQTALLLGCIAGLSAINKSNGFFTLILLPFSLLLFDTKIKKRRVRFLRWVGLSVLAVCIGYGLYSLLRFSPFYHVIDQKNATFVYPFKEWLQHPFTYFWDNLWVGQRDWLVKYFGYPFLLLTLVSFIIKRSHQREKIILLIWFIIPFLALALFGRTIYPRYIFPMTLSLLPLVAYTIYFIHVHFKNVYILICFLTFVLFLPVRSSYIILTDFARAPIPISDLNQYNNDWPSGTGVKESIQFFREQSQQQKITVYTEGTFGLMPYAYELYFYKNPQVKIKGIWPIKDQPSQEMLNDAKKMPTYVVFYQPCPPCEGVGKGPTLWPLEEVMTIKKVALETYLTVYKVRP